MTRNIREPSAKKPKRVGLIPQDFDTLVEHQGVYTRITPVLVCPNKDSKYGTNHDLDCPLCRGKQFIDIDEKSFCEWVFMQSIKVEKQLDVQGIWDVKDCRVSTKATTRLYYQYKVEMLDFESIFNELVERKSTGDVDLLRYDAVRSCSTDFIVVDKNRKFYEVDKDYRVDDKNLTWIGDKPTGLYSISYPVHPTFRIIELINENRNYYDVVKGQKIPIDLPQQAVMRLDYMLENGSLEQR